MKKNRNMQRASLMHITMRIQQSSRRDLDYDPFSTFDYNYSDFPGSELFYIGNTYVICNRDDG